MILSRGKSVVGGSGSDSGSGVDSGSGADSGSDSGSGFDADSLSGSGCASKSTGSLIGTNFRASLLSLSFSSTWLGSLMNS